MDVITSKIHNMLPHAPVLTVCSSNLAAPQILFISIHKLSFSYFIFIHFLGWWCYMTTDIKSFIGKTSCRSSECTKMPFGTALVRCKLHFGSRVGQLFKKCSELSILFPHSHLPPPLGSFTLASFFLLSHSRHLMLPLTCTASMVCPLPENQVQPSMVTRSVHRQMPDRHIL